jgi:sulfur-oxidizing protein SoxY
MSPAFACSRRQLLLLMAVAAPLRGLAAAHVPPATQAAIDAFAQGRTIESGRFTLDIASLVENGNTVPVTIRVESPMSPADFIRRIALFTEANPQPEVAVFHLSPINARAQVATRMRLASTQNVHALAERSDGRILHTRVQVIVTLAACIEGAA